MKKKLFVLLMPLLLFGLTGCVLYNGQGKPSKSSNSQKQESQESSISSSDADGSQASIEPSSEPSSAPEGSDASSSVDSGPSSDVTPASDELPKGTEVTLYLVFGANGLYKNEAVNGTKPDKFLEHVVEYKGKVGDALPNDKEVTSTVEGSKFAYWTAYNNDGKLTNYFLIPGYDGKILYASFFGGEGGPHTDDPSEEPIVPSTPTEYAPSSTGTLPTTGYGFLFGDGTFMEAVRAKDDNGFQQHLINNRAFKKDQIFQLCNFGEGNAVWTVDIDPYSFGGNSSTSTNWKEYLIHDTYEHVYKVVKDFDVVDIYIKLKHSQDQLFFKLAS